MKLDDDRAKEAEALADAQRIAGRLFSRSGLNTSSAAPAAQSLMLGALSHHLRKLDLHEKSEGAARRTVDLRSMNTSQPPSPPLPTCSCGPFEGGAGGPRPGDTFCNRNTGTRECIPDPVNRYGDGLCPSDFTRCVYGEDWLAESGALAWIGLLGVVIGMISVIVAITAIWHRLRHMPNGAGGTIVRLHCGTIQESIVRLLCRSRYR